MPTDFDWKTWKRKKEEPAPPPPEEPKTDKNLALAANVLFYIVIAVGLFNLWIFMEDSNQILKIIDTCNEQKGVAVKTLRGDAVCIKQDVLTNVLDKNTNRAN